MGFNCDGKIKAMKIDIIADGGAYVSMSPFVTWRSVVQATGPYGGTDIFPGFHIESKIFVNIDVLLDIKRISTLKKIVERKDSVEIGAAITFSEIIESEIIKKYFPLLVKAASQIGSVQIRNRATIVGNFVNNAPCADSVPPLLVYDAKIEIQSLTRKK